MVTERIIIEDTDQIDLVKLEKAARILRAGGLVAFPTETVYGLGANALDENAAKKIYAAKGRPSDNPLIAHIADFDELKPLVAEIPKTAEKLMTAFWPGPLTLIFPKSDAVPYETTGGLDTVAVRMPSDPTASALIRLSGVPVAAPSANTSGRPSPTTAEHVWQDMNGKIDMIVDGGPVGIGVESTIIDVSGDMPVILRPGAVTQEMAGKVLGMKIGLDPAITGDEPMNADVKPRAPGMKYKHYAPKADLTLVEGDTDGVTEVINRMVKEKLEAGYLVGIICTEETREKYPQGMVRSMGIRAKEETIAHNLYAVLREFDDLEADFIYSESFSADHLGQAIMNRLKKAAGYHIIKVLRRDKMSEKREDYITWDEYFMGVAMLSGKRSKDPSTQVGACIVSQDNKILSMGYNGFPKGCSDNEFPWGKEHEKDDPYNAKYFYSTHSELNAILNYRGGSLEGCKLYVTLFPCNECAKAIIQSGIKTIVYGSDKYDGTPSVNASKRMLNAAGVRYYQYQPTGRKIEIEV